jgi:hypothetical protein
LKVNSNKKKGPCKSGVRMKFGSGGEKENFLFIPTPMLKNEKLDTKEKDIIRRINRIENFLNK